MEHVYVYVYVYVYVCVYNRQVEQQVQLAALRAPGRRRLRGRAGGAGHLAGRGLVYRFPHRRITLLYYASYLLFLL